MLNHSNLVYELREEITKLKRFEKEAKDSRENIARLFTNSKKGDALYGEEDVGKVRGGVESMS